MKSAHVERPFIIRRDGTLVDRASGAIIGRVWLTNLGWVAENSGKRFEGYGARHMAARAAWEDWRGARDHE
jgi:hypothetical protein